MELVNSILNSTSKNPGPFEFAAGTETNGPHWLLVQYCPDPDEALLFCIDAEKKTVFPSTNLPSISALINSISIPKLGEIANPKARFW